MKKSIKAAVAVAALSVALISGQGEARAHVYVRIAPPRIHAVKVVRPARLFRHAVWVSGHYRYRHGAYVWVSGYWIKPRHGYYYVQSHWQPTRYGYRFVPGHWARK